MAPYGREAEINTLNLLDDALLKAVQPTSEVILKQLRESAPKDVSDLLPEVEKRGGQLADQAEKKLAERGAKEAKDMRAILDDQKKRITTTAKANRQLSLLDYFADEIRQIEADKRHWDRRLGQLDRELLTEPERIEAIYKVKARRVEPVGLVYLWPVTG